MRGTLRVGFVGLIWRMLETATTLDDFKTAQAGLLRFTLEGRDEARAFAMAMSIGEYQKRANECIRRFEPGFKDVAGAALPGTAIIDEDKKVYMEACYIISLLSITTDRVRFGSKPDALENRFRIYASLVGMDFTNEEFEETRKDMAGKVMKATIRASARAKKIAFAIDAIESDWIKYVALGLWKWNGISMEYSTPFSNVLEHSVFIDVDAFSSLTLT